MGGEVDMAKQRTADITHEVLLSEVHYDPLTGIFRWRRSRSGRKMKYDVAGSISDKQYWVIMIDGKLYKAHRLAWFYVTGEWPEHDIDHRDGNETNNKFDNLRECSHSQNMGNRKVGVNNTSGFKGVSFHKKNQKWRAYITLDKRRRCLGYFDDPASAGDAYFKAAVELFGEFARAA